MTDFGDPTILTPAPASRPPRPPVRDFSPPRNAPAFNGPASRLPADAVIFDSLPTFSPRQLAMGAGLENPQRTTELAWDAMQGPNASEVLCPRDFLYCNLWPPSSLAAPSSSGTAARLSAEGARAHAAFELIERDAILRHWLAGLPGDHVSLAEAGALGEVASAFARRGFALSMLDCSIPRGPAVVVAVLTAAEAAWPDTVIASAAHPDPVEASRHAVSELRTAYELAMSTGPRGVPSTVQRVHSPGDHAAFYWAAEHRDWIRHFREPEDVISFADWSERSRISCGPVDRDSSALAGFLREAGYTPTFLDLTAPSLRPIGIHVARCFAPEAIPLEFGLGRVRELIPAAPVAALGSASMNRPHPFG